MPRSLHPAPAQHFQSPLFDVNKTNQGRLTQNQLRAIFGSRLYGIDDWKQLFPHLISIEAQTNVPPFPWREEILNQDCPFHLGKSIGQSHIAFLGMQCARSFPVTLRRWELIAPSYFHPDMNDWAQICPFYMKTTCVFRWYLMPSAALPSFSSTKWKAKTEQMPAGYEIPSTIEEVTKYILSRRRNGRHLVSSRSWIGCSDITSHLNTASQAHVIFRATHRNGIQLCFWSDTLPRDSNPAINRSLRLAASRKIPDIY